jgi:hypothetical protein
MVRSSFPFGQSGHQWRRRYKLHECKTSNYKLVEPSDVIDLSMAFSSDFVDNNVLNLRSMPTFLRWSTSSPDLYTAINSGQDSTWT